MIFLGVILGVISRLLDGAGGNSAASIFLASIFAFAMLPLPRPAGHAASAFPLDGPLWSLTYEFLSNILYGLFAKYLTTRICLILLAPLIVALFFISYLLGGMNYGIDWGLGSVLAIVRVLCPFLIGLVIYRLLDTSKFKTNLFQYIVPIAFLAVLILPIADARLYAPIVICTVFPAIIVISAKCRDEGPLKKVFSWLGNLSYPIYALNQPVFRLLSVLAGALGIKPGLVFAAISFVICVVIAHIVLMVYDGPVRAFLTTKFGRPRTLAPAPERAG